MSSGNFKVCSTNFWKDGKSEVGFLWYTWLASPAGQSSGVWTSPTEARILRWRAARPAVSTTVPRHGRVRCLSTDRRRQTKETDFRQIIYRSVNNKCQQIIIYNSTALKTAYLFINNASASEDFVSQTPCRGSAPGPRWRTSVSCTCVQYDFQTILVPVSLHSLHCEIHGICSLTLHANASGPVLRRTVVFMNSRCSIFATIFVWAGVYLDRNGSCGPHYITNVISNKSFKLLEQFGTVCIASVCCKTRSLLLLLRRYGRHNVKWMLHWLPKLISACSHVDCGSQCAVIGRQADGEIVSSGDHFCTLMLWHCDACITMLQTVADESFS